jgi:mRNA-degrading endonuclease RelE of RelBE toxin-antitoxin system
LPAGHVTRLQGQQAARFRLRVGDWRVIFTMDAVQRTIFVSLIRSRGDAYRP